ncbi:hypothetical protein [Nocardia sp. NPDC050793]|uniref:hypothetical protein n=1 Tax=Nocardia sp. NPDC050793 TaxID=3155159 RepID=UPI003406E05E
MRVARRAESYPACPWDGPGSGEQGLRDHSAILEALRKCRAKVASTLMRDHIVSGADELVAMLEEQGLWAEGGRKSTA